MKFYVVTVVVVVVVVVVDDVVVDDVVVAVMVVAVMVVAVMVVAVMVALWSFVNFTLHHHSSLFPAKNRRTRNVTSWPSYVCCHIG